VPTTAETVARVVLDHLLQRWPGGTLASEALAGVLAPSITRAHELAQLTLRANVPFDVLLAAAVGAGRSTSTGEALGRLAGERFIALLGAATVPGSATPVGSSPSVAVSSLPPPGQGPGFQPPTAWTDRELIRALMRLGRVALPDLAALPGRLALASVVAGAAVAMPGIRSTRDVGNRVHAELARRYCESYAPPNLVVAERRVYGGFPPRFTGQPLASVAGLDPRLSVCYHAWLNPNYGGKLPWVSNRRPDIADLGRNAHWEVKPFLQAPIGVIQDTWYRAAYNYVADVWANESPQLQGLLGSLLPGGPWELSLCGQVDVTAELGFPAVAMPMTLPLLNGLVLYAVFSGPQMIDVAELALLLYLWLRQQIQRRQQQLEKLARQTEEALRSMCRWVAENWQMLVAIVVIAFIVTVAIVATLGSGGNPLPAMGAAALIIFLLNRLGRPADRDRGPIRPEGSLTTINFPGVSITMYPQDIGGLLASAEAIYSASMATIARVLRPSMIS
jgi:hypothetical protein